MSELTTLTPTQPHTIAIAIVTERQRTPTVARWKFTTDSRFWLHLLGVLMLVWWGWYWFGCFEKQRLRRLPQLNYYGFPIFHVDFLHNYLAVQHWQNGGNPYVESFNDPLDRKLCYPPIVLACFSWCTLVAPVTAVKIWGYSLGAFAMLGSWAAWRVRNSLRITPVPVALGIGWIVTSIPVGYALERGNYDLLIVPLMLLAAVCLKRRNIWTDAIAGAAIALTVGLKVYPGVLLLGLLPLRRGRAFVFTLLFGLLFVSFQYQNLPAAARNLAALAAFQDPARWHFHIFPATHSLMMNWQALWIGSRLEFLALIPSAIAAVLLLLPAILWVSWRIYQCPQRDRLMIPFFLWLLAAGSFGPKVANDYNLFFLPMAALAVWDKRDPVWVHAILGFLILLLQPIPFALSQSVVLGGKLLAVYAVMTCLLARIADSTLAPVTIGGQDGISRS